ncbi:MAG: hypothetical protein JST78_00690 [Bacteroidetes bacterium]|nr:hypothetical protein [Bacteroidota bacterium]
MKRYSVLLIFTLFISAIFSACVTEDDTTNPGSLNLQPSACDTPAYFSVGNLSGTSVTLDWDQTTGSIWEIQFGQQGFRVGTGTSVFLNSTHRQIFGLDPTVNYEFYIRTRCNSVQNSQWLGPVLLGGQAEFCSEPTEIQVERNAADDSKALLSWSAAGASAWDIQYGVAGFALGTGTNTTSSTPTKAITGLTSEAYDFYVRAHCSDTQNSDWVGPIELLAVNEVDHTAIMTANIGGTQYNQMQPYMYPTTPAVMVINPDATAGEHKYLQIQGDTSNDITTSIEFNFYLPDNLWQPGTYPINNFTDWVTSSVVQLTVVSEPLASPTIIKRVVEGSGNIVVAEFNLTERRVRGTFSFSYTKQVEGSPDVQTVEVTNGTFNYALDDDYFN